MATKTRGKTPTPKPAPVTAGRKTTAPQKAAQLTPIEKPPKKGAPAAAESPTSAKELTREPEKTEASRRATPHPETVSLIDQKRPAKKSKDGEVKTKRTVLPPISRIRASLEAASKPSPSEPVPVPEPQAPEAAEQPSAEEIPTPEIEAGPQQKVLLIKPPIVVKLLATEL